MRGGVLCCPIGGYPLAATGSVPGTGSYGLFWRGSVGWHARTSRRQSGSGGRRCRGLQTTRRGGRLGSFCGRASGEVVLR